MGFKMADFIYLFESTDFVLYICIINFQLKYLSVTDLEARMERLDAEMEKEIDELRTRYQLKRQPIIEAIDVKRKRQQNF